MSRVRARSENLTRMQPWSLVTKRYMNIEQIVLWPEGMDSKIPTFSVRFRLSESNLQFLDNERSVKWIYSSKTTKPALRAGSTFLVPSSGIFSNQFMQIISGLSPCPNSITVPYCEALKESGKALPPLPNF